VRDAGDRHGPDIRNRHRAPRRRRRVPSVLSPQSTQGPACGRRVGAPALRQRDQRADRIRPVRVEPARVGSELPASGSGVTAASLIDRRFRMNASLKTALAVIGVCLLPLTVLAQKVSVDYDKDADFSKYSTYAWKPG